MSLARTVLFRSAALSSLVLGSCALGGCEHIPVQMHTSMTVQHADGTVDHKETHWQGSLAELPGHMEELGHDLSMVTGELIKKLTEVPPPGHVKLGDLAPGLAKHENRPETNFLLNAKDEKTGDIIPFEYVKIGVQDYDAFFQTAQEIYALVYECTQAISQMRELAKKILNDGVDAKTEIFAQIDKVRAKLAGGAQVDSELVQRFNLLVDLGGVLAQLVPSIGQKAIKLAQQGQALVTNAQAAITNPKVLIHLDLIKKGVIASAKAMKDSGEVLVDFGQKLVHVDEKAQQAPQTTG
jgi:hypothetical protein